MKTQSKTKQLLKILIGAAWIDGMVQVEEREYLHRMVDENGLAEDAEIKGLLLEIRQVKPSECYEWLETYLGDNPSAEDYEQLMEALSTIIYSDGEVDTEEAKLLTRLQLLDPGNEAPKTAFDKVLKSVQKLYRQALDQQL